MKTPADYFWNEIEWEIGELLESDFDGRMEVFVAIGIDSGEQHYEASAYFYGGEFEEMKNISFA